MSGSSLALLAATALVAILALLWPLLRRGATGEQGHAVALYRRQLGELDRDVASGRLDTREAEAARAEIGRRLLRAARRAPVPLQVTRTGRMAVLAVALAAPLGATLLYARLGSPGLPDAPLASRREQPEDTRLAAIRDMVSGLEKRLGEGSDDLEGWLMLGRSRLVLGDAVGAVAALRQAQTLAPEDPRLPANLGEALTAAAGGIVTPEARTLFERAAGAAPLEPRAGYYLGLAEAQAGNAQGAATVWRQLLAAAPPDAPWRADVINAIRAAAPGLGLDLETLFAGLDRAGGEIDRERAEGLAALPPDEQAQAIRIMVEQLESRLETSGGDVEGWQRLAEARMVLGEPDKARRAYDRALELAPGDPATLTGYGELLLGPKDPRTRLPRVGDDALALFERAAAAAPSAPGPQWYLGIRALQDGRLDLARAAWQRALEALPPDDPSYTTVRALLDAIDRSENAAPAAGG